MFFLEWMEVNGKGNLEVEGYDLVELAREYGTPLYVYNEEQMRRKCRNYVDSLRANYPDGEIIYAGKAFLVKAMCRLLAEEGLSLDVVSGGEIYTALQAGYPMERVYFHGNNKTPQELEMALDMGVGRIVVDSIMELDLLNGIAAKKEKNADILFRVKPGVSAHTHSYIQTGQMDSKFGLGIEDGQAMEAVQKALDSSYINLHGIHCHIGSQIFDVQEPYRLVAQKMVGFLNEVRENAEVTLQELNVGGGLGIRHTSQDSPVAIEDFVQIVSEAVRQECEKNNFPLPKLMMEPGRSICGEPGITLYTVGNIKDIPGIRTYVSVDGGMMDNLRPALYNASYEAVLANKATESPEATVTVAGKVCESGDVLIKDLEIPSPERGDIMAVLTTGAYHFSMYSDYNRNPRPPVVFLRNGQAKEVVRRETFEDIVGMDIIPSEFEEGGNE